MSTFLKGTTAVLVFLGCAAPALADSVYVWIDLSASTRFSTEAAFARHAGDWVTEALEDLPEGSTVHLETLGDYGLGANLKRAALTVSPRKPARKVAKTVGGLVARMPELVTDGTLGEARSTHILSRLENASYAMDCVAEPTRILLLTDGVEWSEDVDGAALIRGEAGLPRPASAFLDGCAVTMLGIGETQGGTPALTRHLIKEWKAWTAAAGVSRFQPLPTF
ncbi:hypothetical protein [Rhodospirillum sp. A1_3_36]|uniref:hypothetical protein n=1 Tax=Rhodospirillum sp. A1_3_36 TaxID=3391666 RepID=UPI0039A69C1D